MFGLIIKLPPLAFFSLCFWIILLLPSSTMQNVHKIRAETFSPSKKSTSSVLRVGRMILKGFIFRVMHHRLLNVYGHNTKSKEWFNTRLHGIEFRVKKNIEKFVRRKLCGEFGGFMWENYREDFFAECFAFLSWNEAVFEKIYRLFELLVGEILGEDEWFCEILFIFFRNRWYHEYHWEKSFWKF